MESENIRPQYAPFDNEDHDVEGEGFVLKKHSGQSLGGHRGELARLEFRQGETTGKAHIRENLEKNKMDKDWVERNLQPGEFVHFKWLDRGSGPTEEPKEVVRISEDRKLVFVKGSDVGIPVDQVDWALPPL